MENKYSSQHFNDYRKYFHFPCVDQLLITTDEGQDLPLITLPQKVFPYSTTHDYEFSCAIMDGDKGKLLFVRIEQYDPIKRKSQKEQLDFCIPLAHEQMSEEEKIVLTIPFGGSWSDCDLVCLLVFTQDWEEKLSKLENKMAFCNPDNKSAALWTISSRDDKTIKNFCR